VNRVKKFGEFKRLGHEVVRPKPYSLESDINVADACHHDDPGADLLRFQVAEDADTVQTRHPDIEKYEIELEPVDFLDCVVPVLRSFYFKPLIGELVLYQLPQRTFVVGIEQTVGHKRVKDLSKEKLALFCQEFSS